MVNSQIKQFYISKCDRPAVDRGVAHQLGAGLAAPLAGRRGEARRVQTVCFHQFVMIAQVILALKKRGRRDIW